MLFPNMDRIVRTLIYISFCVLLLSCIQKQTGEKSAIDISSYYYPDKESFQRDATMVKIQLRDYASYSELMQALDSVTCADQTPVIIYQNDSSQFHLVPDHPCPDRAIVYDFKDRNRVRITKDSIQSWLSSYDRDLLSEVVKSHIMNRGEDVQYSESTEKAFFSIQQDSTMDIDDLTRILISISEAFNELNGQNGNSLSLHIQIGEKPIIPVQPPPAKRDDQH